MKRTDFWLRRSGWRRSSFMLLLHNAVVCLYLSCPPLLCPPRILKNSINSPYWLRYDLFNVCWENSVVLEDIVDDVLYPCNINFNQRLELPDKKIIISDQSSMLLTTVSLVSQPTYQCCSAVKAGLKQVIPSNNCCWGKWEYLPKVKTKRITMLVSSIL